ncbi:MAG: flippase-like domain-containing protein [Deltaproteobacteria bacterium]|nr:flippase-like domain-containing protein [Deltaproteobacteria bacterium]
MRPHKGWRNSIGWKFWAGLLISALFLYLAFRRVDLKRMWEVIRYADPIYLSLIVLLTFFTYILRAWRWAVLLEPIKKTRFSRRLSAILIGFAANCIFPARLGEFIRANSLGRTEEISASSAFGTIVVERLFDGFTLLLILMIGLLGTDFPLEWQGISGSLRATGFFLFASYTFLIIVLIGFKIKTDPFLRFLERVLFFLPRHFRSRLIDMIRNFALGLVLVRRPLRWLQAVFYSLLLWFSALVMIQLTESSIGLSLPFIATFLIMAMASFGVMIPSAPGFIGTFHLSVQYGFLFYGVGKEEALSGAILWHAAMVVPTMIFGLVAYILSHLRSPAEDRGVPGEARPLDM